MFLDHFLDRVGGSFIIAAHHVRIDIQRRARISVPEPLRDCSQRNVPAQQLGSMGMAQVVEPSVSCADALREDDVGVLGRIPLNNFGYLSSTAQPPRSASYVGRCGDETDFSIWTVLWSVASVSRVEPFEFISFV